MNRGSLPRGRGRSIVLISNTCVTFSFGVSLNSPNICLWLLFMLIWVVILHADVTLSHDQMHPQSIYTVKTSDHTDQEISQTADSEEEPHNNHGTPERQTKQIN